MLNQAERNAPIAAPYIQGDYPAYYSQASGKVIEGRYARREDLKQTNCREVDPSEGPGGYLSSKFERKVKDGARARGR